MFTILGIGLVAVAAWGGYELYKKYVSEEGGEEAPDDGE